jgi:hypothetical protein
MPFKRPKGGIDLWFKLKSILFPIFKYKGTYVYKCNFKENTTDIALCYPIESTRAVMNNGIAFDGVSTVLVA